MKSQSYTQIPEYELVRMVVVGLDFSIQKKLVNQLVRDMAQLVERVKRIEQIKYKKERHKRFDKNRREKIAYLKPYKDNDNSINYQDIDVNKEEDEICMA